MKKKKLQKRKLVHQGHQVCFLANLMIIQQIFAYVTTLCFNTCLCVFSDVDGVGSPVLQEAGVMRDG